MSRGFIILSLDVAILASDELECSGAARYMGFGCCLVSKLYEQNGNKSYESEKYTVFCLDIIVVCYCDL